MPITRVPLSNVRGQPNGVAGLDADGRVTAPRRGEVNILDSGLADPTGENSNDAALAAAMAEVSANTSSVYVGGPRLKIPPGLYGFDNSVQVKKSCIIEGDAVGQAGGFATKLMFPADTHGFIVHRYNTFGEGVEDPATFGGDATIIRNLELAGTRSGTTGHGIWLRARADIENVRISGFDGNGIHVVASGGAGGADEGNANNFRVTHCRITGCRYGAYVNGADANVGKFDHVDCSGNDGWGFFDSSFLGNTYDTCHTASNGALSQVSHGGNRYYVISDTLGGITEPGTDSDVWVLIGSGGVHAVYPAWVPGGIYIEGGAYKADSNNGHNGKFDNCYSEPAQPPSNVIRPWMVVGGHHGASFVPGRDGSYYRSGVMPSFEVESTLDSARAFKFRFGYAANDAISVETTGDHPSGLSLLKWDEATGCWVVRHANSVARTPIRYTTDLNTITAGRSAALGAGEAVFAQGLWLGSSTTTVRKQDSGTAAPTTGEWARGDIRWHSSPTSGGNAGWICTVGGSPGTWNAFGTIE